MNFRRAGMLKNRSRTETVVPDVAGRILNIDQAAALDLNERCGVGFGTSVFSSSTFATEAIDGKCLAAKPERADLGQVLERD